MIFKVEFFKTKTKIYEYLFSSLKEAMIFNMAMLKKGFKSDITRLNMNGDEIQ